MTAAAMATFEARAGAALIRRFANASADFGGGLVVEGVFSDPALSQDLAALTAIGRDPVFDLLAEDLGGWIIERNTPLEIVRTINDVTTRVRYMARGEPVAHTEHGTLQIALEKER